MKDVSMICISICVIGIGFIGIGVLVLVFDLVQFIQRHREPKRICKDRWHGEWAEVRLMQAEDRLQEKQRCNHCDSVFDEDLAECPECGMDDALMYPIPGPEGAR